MTFLSLKNYSFKVGYGILHQNLVTKPGTRVINTSHKLKSMIKKILISICLLIPMITVAQNKLPQLTPKNPEDISEYISTNFKLQTDSFCLETVIFIRFGVSKKGEIINLAFTKGAPQIITDELKKAVMSSNGHWKISDKEWRIFGKKVYLQPYIISFQAGCSASQNNNSLADYQDSLRKAILKRDQSRISNFAVNNLLKFDDKEFANLDCIILPPISISNMQ